MEYKAIYKCRLCGRTYRSGETTGQAIAEAHMVDMTTGLVCTIPNAPRLLDRHPCGGGTIGLADFQGWKAIPGTLGEKTESGLVED